MNEKKKLQGPKKVTAKKNEHGARSEKKERGKSGNIKKAPKKTGLRRLEKNTKDEDIKWQRGVQR